MSLVQFARNAIKRAFRTVGVVVNRAGSPADRATMEGAFRSLAKRRPGFRTVIDVGASTGLWSEALMKHFPERSYFLVEAQGAHEPALRRFCAEHPNAQYVLAAAGARAGEIYFEALDEFGGQASSVPPGNSAIRIPMVAVDDEVAARSLPGPFLLKLDTHGFEAPILEGAARTLRHTEVIIVECYNFRLSPESLTFDEMCRHLGERGFRCIDLFDPLHRPRDDAFWQMDLVFMRRDRPEFAYTKYR